VCPHSSWSVGGQSIGHHRRFFPLLLLLLLLVALLSSVQALLTIDFTQSLAKRTLVLSGDKTAVSDRLLLLLLLQRLLLMGRCRLENRRSLPNARTDAVRDCIGRSCQSQAGQSASEQLRWRRGLTGRPTH
jgi:hypothetical protein